MISIIITYYTGLNILYSNLSLLLQTNLDNVEIIIVNDNPKVKLTLVIIGYPHYCIHIIQPLIAVQFQPQFLI